MMSDITTKENRGKGMVGTFAYQFLYTFCINYCFMLLYYILHRKWFFCIFLLSKLSVSVILRKNLVLGRTKWPNRPQNDTIGYVRLIVLKLYHKKFSIKVLVISLCTGLFLKYQKSFHWMVYLSLVNANILFCWFSLIGWVSELYWFLIRVMVTKICNSFMNRIHGRFIFMY